MNYLCSRNGAFGFNETWEYDGVDWTLVTTASSPGYREEHAMVYDNARQKVVMFGGYAVGYLNDAWEYDGVNWTQISPPNNLDERHGHAMAYDEARGKVVMFGGANFVSSILGDTWEFDGYNWTEVGA